MDHWESWAGNWPCHAAAKVKDSVMESKPLEVTVIINIHRKDADLSNVTIRTSHPQKGAYSQISGLSWSDPSEATGVTGDDNPSLHIRALHQIVRIYQGRAGICPCGGRRVVWRGRQVGCGEGKEKISEGGAVLVTVAWMRWQSLLSTMGQRCMLKGWRLHISNCRADTVFGLWNANSDSKEAFSYIKWEQITWKRSFKKRELKPPETPNKC